MKRVLAVGVFDLLHAGHLHYLEQAKSLGDELVVIVAHDDTVRQRKHEPITLQDMRKRMVEGLKPVDSVYIGNPPGVSMFDILVDVKPNIIALGYDQEHAEEWIRKELDARNLSHIDVKRVEGLEGDLDGTRKIVSKIIDLWNVVKMDE
ncbi:MAG: FAD synthase [Euryarchaeota archaeon]|nr:FAD synthase [Euryarchaeota archaeon]